MTAKKFEEFTRKILNTYGYSAINPGKRIKGRGTSHQIDALGIVNITPPFSYPITLLAESKYYSGKKSIGIEIIRNFYGVIEDIKQNIPNKFKIPSIESGNEYVTGISNIVGVIISTAGFSNYSKEFAYAHGIFLVTLGKLRNKHTPYFANFAGNLVVIQIPDKLGLEEGIVNIIKTTLNDNDNVWDINGNLKLIEKLEFIGRGMENKEEKTFCYLYEIEIPKLKSKFRTITQEEVIKDSLLTIELPNKKHYITMKIQKVVGN